jgi:dTDP-4-dehydrorhamnose reductase
MRVTVLGATGLLGKRLMKEWTADDITGLGSEQVDIRDASRVLSVVTATRPEWIVLAAAYTDVDGCETNPERAFQVNCIGAVNVAEAARKSSARLLFLSTDYVFDGTRRAPYPIDHPRNPINVYGQSKAQAEVKLLELVPECCIVRTSWLFGVGGKCFPDTILRLAEARNELEVVDDQRGSPTHVPDLAQAIMQLCRDGARGIVHATNRGECSWYELAGFLLKAAGSSTRVRPIPSEKVPRPAKRPAYSVLSAKSLDAYKIAMPSWQEGVELYLDQRKEVEREKLLG